MADQPRFILITPVLPLPTDQGSKYFQLEVARGLSSLGPVTWITREVGDQGRAIAQLRDEGFDLRLDHSFRDRSPLARLKRRVGIDLRAWRAGMTRDETFVCTPTVRALVDEVRQGHPDAFGVAVYWSATPVLEGFAAGRRIFAVSDVDSMRENRGPAPLDRLVAEAERRAFGRAALALTLSEEDREDALALLDGAPAPPFARCPVTIEIPEREPPPSPDGDLLLYGHWEAPFNRDGLQWFLQEVWPVMREHPSQPRLRIVGKGTPEPIADPRVHWAGFVEDLAEEIAGARAVLIPLRYASGLRYRLLESFAHARIVLATTVAARGSDAVAGEHYLQADDPAAWRDALDRLDDRMGVDARRWVTKNHSRAGLAERWAAALSPVLPS